jgi:hypothetical protein
MNRVVGISYPVTSNSPALRKITYFKFCFPHYMNSRTLSLLRISQGTHFLFPTKVISSEQCSNLQNDLVAFLQYLYESLSYKISPSRSSSSFVQVLFYFFNWRMNFICFHKRITRLQAFWLITLLASPYFPSNIHNNKVKEPYCKVNISLLSSARFSIK